MATDRPSRARAEGAPSGWLGVGLVDVGYVLVVVEVHGFDRESAGAGRSGLDVLVLVVAAV